jgi:photosystem II stability/assembly factor-like uncharacterized protein
MPADGPDTNKGRSKPVAKTKTKRRRQAAGRRPVQAPKKREQKRRVPSWTYALGGAVLIAAIAAGAFLLGKDKAQSGGEGPAASTGLPDTPDYHSLLVAPNDANHILLGTHAGLYESRDGGRSWRKAALVGQDAMNLAGSDGETVWSAGHNVFAKSTDGGASWAEVRPEGLPSLDLHGFAVDPRDSRTLYAAVAGQGLYRSDDGGQRFELVSSDVGGAVMALAVTRDGRILAGDMQQGLLASDDRGKTWRPVAQATVMGLAINPADPNTIVAAGPGILLSADNGSKWSQVLALEQGAGPIAWSPSDPDLGYAVGFDRVLYRTSDRGQSWQPVG